MANIKSAEKRIGQTAKKQARNKSVRSRLKSSLKTASGLGAARRRRGAPGDRLGDRHRPEEGRHPQERRGALQVAPGEEGGGGEGLERRVVFGFQFSAFSFRFGLGHPLKRKTLNC